LAAASIRRSVSACANAAAEATLRANAATAHAADLYWRKPLPALFSKLAKQCGEIMEHD